MNDTQIEAGQLKEAVISTSGEKVTSLFHTLVDRSQYLAERLDGRLSSVTREAIPDSEKPDDKKPLKLPGYFQELRELGETIDDNLSYIENILNRIDI